MGARGLSLSVLLGTLACNPSPAQQMPDPCDSLPARIAPSEPEELAEAVFNRITSADYGSICHVGLSVFADYDGYRTVQGTLADSSGYYFIRAREWVRDGGVQRTLAVRRGQNHDFHQGHGKCADIGLTGNCNVESLQESYIDVLRRFMEAPERPHRSSF